MQMDLESKPRVCGDDPPRGPLLVLEDLVNPACAGMIPIPRHLHARRRSKPRVCGDDPGGRDRLLPVSE